MKWTDEKTARLASLWKNGLPAVVIAERMGVTRNTIIGKAYRIGLSEKSRESKGEIWTDDNTAMLRDLWMAGHSARDIAARMTISRHAVLGKTIRMGLRRGRPVGARVKQSAPVDVQSTLKCQWPHGDPRKRGFRFCGKAPVVPGKPYCEAHCQRAYHKVRDEPTTMEAA